MADSTSTLKFLIGIRTERSPGDVWNVLGSFDLEVLAERDITTVPEADRLARASYVVDVDERAMINALRQVADDIEAGLSS